MFVISENCVACGTCLPECPVDAIEEGTPYKINDNCIDCGSCEPVCPVNAISSGT